MNLQNFNGTEFLEELLSSPKQSLQSIAQFQLSLAKDSSADDEDLRSTAMQDLECIRQFIMANVSINRVSVKGETVSE